MAKRHIQRQDLLGKTIDVHTHIGISLERFVQMGFPYASTLEDVYYRQRVNQVDYSTVFPLNADTFFDLPHLVATGEMLPADQPISPCPYALENHRLLTEVFQFCPELAHHFMPFVSLDPGRKVKEQMVVLERLEGEFPIYGLKIVPIACQSSVTHLLRDGAVFLEYAAARDLPILFHVTVHPDETYSQASDTFRIMESHPELRYCLAHSISFHGDYLERAAAMPRVWFETSGLKILSQLTHERSPVMPSPADRLDCDYSDHIRVMHALAARYPSKILWGSDTPYHTYIHRRMQAEGKYYEFRLKGTYEEEKAALDALSDSQRQQINRNTVQFLFGA